MDLTPHSKTQGPKTWQPLWIRKKNIPQNHDFFSGIHIHCYFGMLITENNIYRNHDFSFGYHPNCNSEFTPEKWWLVQTIRLPIGVLVTFQGRAVKLRGGIFLFWGVCITGGCHGCLILKNHKKPRKPMTDQWEEFSYLQIHEWLSCMANV